MAKKAKATKASEPEVTGEAATEGKAGKKKGTAKPALPIIHISDKALSTDVGVRVLGYMNAALEGESEAKRLASESASKRYESLSLTTAAIVKAAKADKTIDLSKAFGESKDYQPLVDQLHQALGIKTIAKTGTTERLVYASNVVNFFPVPGDKERDAALYAKKRSLQTNFAHQLKKCAQAAEQIIASKMQAKHDDATGTLMISGPAVKEQFGASSVLLNEKQTVGEGSKKKTLAAKPSFTALASKAAESHGKVLQKRADSRVASGAIDPELAVTSVCHGFLEMLKKVPAERTDKMNKALESVYNSLDKLFS